MANALSTQTSTHRPRILAELQRDGGLTNQELADRVGLSASPCSRRVQALEEAGVIRKRVVLLDAKKLGLDSPR